MIVMIVMLVMLVALSFVCFGSLLAITPWHAVVPVLLIGVVVSITVAVAVMALRRERAKRANRRPPRFWPEYLEQWARDDPHVLQAAKGRKKT